MAENGTQGSLSGGEHFVGLEASAYESRGTNSFDSGGGLSGFSMDMEGGAKRVKTTGSRAARFGLLRMRVWDWTTGGLLLN